MLFFWLFYRERMGRVAKFQESNAMMKQTIRLTDDTTVIVTLCDNERLLILITWQKKIIIPKSMVSLEKKMEEKRISLTIERYNKTFENLKTLNYNAKG